MTDQSFRVTTIRRESSAVAESAPPPLHPSQEVLRRSTMEEAAVALTMTVRRVQQQADHLPGMRLRWPPVPADAQICGGTLCPRLFQESSSQMSAGATRGGGARTLRCQQQESSSEGVFRCCDGEEQGRDICRRIRATAATTEAHTAATLHHSRRRFPLLYRSCSSHHTRDPRSRHRLHFPRLRATRSRDRPHREWLGRAVRPDLSVAEHWSRQHGLHTAR